MRGSLSGGRREISVIKYEQSLRNYFEAKQSTLTR